MRLIREVRSFYSAKAKAGAWDTIILASGLALAALADGFGLRKFLARAVERLLLGGELLLQDLALAVLGARTLVGGLARECRRPAPGPGLRLPFRPLPRRGAQRPGGGR